MGMRLPPSSHAFGPLNPQGASGALFSGLFGPLKPQLAFPMPLIQAPTDILSTLEALEQWRVKEDDLRKQTARWSLAQCPLTVSVQPFPEAGEFRDFISPAALLAVMRQWEAATQGAIHFRLLPAAGHLPAMENEANISIIWDAETTLGREYEVGHTNRQVQGKRLTRVTITLITQPLIDAHLNRQQRQQRLLTTVLHETGHALGLEHSDDHRDVMHHRGWRQHELSENDIRRLRRLYELE